MAGIFNKTTQLYERSIDLFGDDIGVLVESLLLLDNRIYSTKKTAGYLTDVERWILSNIGLPEWTAPHLHIQLTYCDMRNVFVVAEVEGEGEIFIQANGYVVLGTDSIHKYLNSNCLSFLKTIAMHSIFIQQSRLVYGSDALIDSKVSINLKDSFSVVLREIDNNSIETWLHLYKRWS